MSPLQKRIDLMNELGITIPDEMFDFLLVMVGGAKKHGPNNWLNPDGAKSSHVDMHASIFRHVAQSSAGVTVDEDSGLHPLLHAACRCLMHYTRLERGL